MIVITEIIGCNISKGFFITDINYRNCIYLEILRCLPMDSETRGLNKIVREDTVMADNFQRTGSVSNAHVGHDFEQDAIRVLSECGIDVYPDFAVQVGIAGIGKNHKFDLGSNSPPILVECKSHKWTSGGNVPSAKMTVWNEAMYYFYCAPSCYRKILFVLRNERSTTRETLAAYYIRTYEHLIPEGVEIWELNQDSGKCDIVWDQVCGT